MQQHSWSGMLDRSSGGGGEDDQLHQMLLAQIGRTQQSASKASWQQPNSHSFVVHRSTPPRSVGRSFSMSMSTPTFLSSMTPAHPRQSHQESAYAMRNAATPRGAAIGLDGSIRDFGSVRERGFPQTSSTSSPRNAPVLMRKWACSTIQRFILRMTTSAQLSSGWEKWTHAVALAREEQRIWQQVKATHFLSLRVANL